jgi:hypothetical protein
VLAVFHLKVVSAHVQRKAATMPRRCAYLRWAFARLQIDMFDSCSKISTHPLRDLHERGQSMKPTRGAISALRHNVLVVHRGERKRISLTRHVVLLLLLRLLLVSKCMSAHSELDVSATSLENMTMARLRAAQDGCPRRAGKEMGTYARVCLSLKKRRPDSLPRETNSTPTPSLCCFLRSPSQKPGAFAVEMATLSQVGRKA